MTIIFLVIDKGNQNETIQAYYNLEDAKEHIRWSEGAGLDFEIKDIFIR